MDCFRTSSPLLGSNKSRSPARSLLLPKDAISDRTSSPVDFTSSPNKRKTPSYNNQYHKNHHSKQENSKQQNCSSATLSNAASPCHLEPQSGDRELSLANNHHAGDQNASKQTAFSNSPNFSSTSSAPLSWKGSSHGGRRSPLKGLKIQQKIFISTDVTIYSNNFFKNIFYDQRAKSVERNLALGNISMKHLTYDLA